MVGWDGARLAMLLAVLETRCGLALGGRDVYLNVAGGLRIGEPAADLAVAGALVSALFDRPVPPAAVLFGEVGLAGEVRAVGHTEARLKEAAKLGFEQIIMPMAGAAARTGRGLIWDPDSGNQAARRAPRAAGLRRARPRTDAMAIRGPPSIVGAACRAMLLDIGRMDTRPGSQLAEAHDGAAAHAG